MHSVVNTSAFRDWSSGVGSVVCMYLWISSVEWVVYLSMVYSSAFSGLE